MLALSAGGTDAIARVVDGWTDEQWELPACGTWSGREVVGHLVCVVGWYHAWLDRALAGVSSPPFPASELQARNRDALATLPTASDHARLSEFQREARRYAERLAPSWDLPYGYPFGTATAGLHAGAAASEWHLHAWDLATATGGTHEPSDPHALFVATASCMLTAQGGVRGRIGSWLTPTLAKRDPWNQLLRRSGRDPTRAARG